MADKRMFAKSIIESDPFMDMPAEAQMLYVRLNMAADDDGFCDNPRSIMRACGATLDSMKLLISKKFVIEFAKDDNVIVVIKHWRMNNYIRKDTYHETKYKEFLRELYYDENRAYSLNPGDGHVPCIAESCSTPGPEPSQRRDEPVPEPSLPRDEPMTQNRLDKNRLDKVSVDKSKGKAGNAKQDAFESWWDLYPKKSGDIRLAYQEYLFALDDVSADELYKSLKAQVDNLPEEDLKYFPSADKWLRNRTWRKKVVPKQGKPRAFTPTEF